jgi:hypothetical protein
MAQTAPATGPIQDVSHPTRTTNKLEDQAAIAALYVTKHDNAPKTGREFLDNDNKLSSAGESSVPECADPCLLTKPAQAQQHSSNTPRRKIYPPFPPPD